MSRIYPVSFLGSCYSRTSPHELISAIESISLSTHLPAEIILVVDGPVPSDLTLSIERLQALYPSLYVFSLDTNLGLGNALKFGLDKCTYDLVFRFDADDICFSHRLAVQYNYLISNPDVSCCGSDIYEFRRNGSNLYSRIKSVPRSCFYLNSLFRNPLNHPSVAFRKRHVLAVGGYVHCNYFEDYFLWIRMLTLGYQVRNLDCFPFVGMDRPSFKFRRSGISYFLDELSFGLTLCVYSHTTFAFALPVIARAFFRFAFSSLVNSTPWRGSWTFVDPNHLSDFSSLDRDRIVARFLK